MLFSFAGAQPVVLRSTGIRKAFQLSIYPGADGKGACVQYLGQHGFIPLKLKSRVAKGGVSKVVYVWDEVIDGKATGSYGLSMEAGSSSTAWYKRNKDNKIFKLAVATSRDTITTLDKYLLHGTLISFSHSTNKPLLFSYPDGSSKLKQLPDFDQPDPLRMGTIADYNFDGYDDVAFSIPDAGMGVYRIFSIYLYHPSSKRFEALTDPDHPKASCAGLCDVTLNQKNKLLYTSCRGGANWWKDVYRYSDHNTLIWLKSEKLN
ncbi:XAC2610-related protein [Pedobacter frigidisoli]|uniref:XAC2610-related protein n=1 Tax=Pedobacter frigidisoli TaxID=2530455 RepID=UPI00292DAD97|nr:hypothetical protein [Pedobacter frigidisoli]